MAHNTDDWLAGFEEFGANAIEAADYFNILSENQLWDMPAWGIMMGIETGVYHHPVVEPDEIIPGFFEIGAAFDGIMQIEEVDRPLFYIPSGFNCALKCYAKYLGVELDPKDLKQAGASLKAIRRVVQENGYRLDQTPRFVRETKDGKWERTNKDFKTDVTDAVIALLQVSPGRQHAVLIKTGRYNDVSPAAIRVWLNVTKNSTLTDKQHYVPPVQQYPYAERCFVYDLETPAIFENEGKNRKIRELIPYGAALQLIDLTDAKAHGPIQQFIGLDCVDQMLAAIRETVAALPGMKRITVFAHNGGAFDHIFLKKAKGIRFVSQLKAAGRIKSLKITFDDVKDSEVNFLDSYSFTQLSLKQSAETFKTSKKMEFDIADRDLKYYQENADWIPYMEQDVKVLGEVVWACNNLMHTYGECITRSTGIAAVAWRLLRKASYHMGNQYTTGCPVTRAFIRSGCYGGRLLHWKKRLEKGRKLLCLDGNSLYPSAMALGMYPVGKYEIMTADDCKVAAFIARIQRGYPAMAEVTFDAGNCRYPLIPHRTEEGALIYPAGKFTGVYTSVEVLEALSLGYKVLEVKKGIKWHQSKKVFERVLTSLYEQRKTLKAEGNPGEYLMKILYNSMYGKMLEAVRGVTKFKDTDAKLSPREKVQNRTDLANGQSEYNVRLAFAQMRKPTHQGAFILSYARAIMNKLIIKVGPENVYYSDTDSIYVDAKAAAGVVESEDLGGFKNDYGKNILINSAIFLDLKRYFLKFEKADGKPFIKKGDPLPKGGAAQKDEPTYKAKFNGLAFGSLDGKALQNWVSDQAMSPIERLYEWFAANPGKQMDLPVIQDKWVRTVDTVRILEKELKFQIDPAKRAQWQPGAEFYPLGYDFAKPERKYPTTYRSTIEGTRHLHTDDYDAMPESFRTALPVYCEEGKGAALRIHDLPKAMQDSYRPTIVGTPDGQRLLRIVDRKMVLGELTESVKYFDIGEYGPTTERDDVANHDTIIITLPAPSGATPSQVLNSQQHKQLLDKIKTLVKQYAGGTVQTLRKKKVEDPEMDALIDELVG